MSKNEWSLEILEENRYKEYMEEFRKDLDYHKDLPYDDFLNGMYKYLTDSRGTFTVDTLRCLMANEMFTDQVTMEDSITNYMDFYDIHPSGLVYLGSLGFLTPASFQIENDYYQAELIRQSIKEFDVIDPEWFVELANTTTSLLVQEAILEAVERGDVYEEEVLTVIEEWDDITTLKEKIRFIRETPLAFASLTEEMFRRELSLEEQLKCVKADILTGEGIIGTPDVRLKILNQIPSMYPLFLYDTNEQVLSKAYSLVQDKISLVDHDNPQLRLLLANDGIGLSVLKWDEEETVRQAVESK